ncbi:peptidoglycan DD-metalloendopeptidase family protein [Alistipes sp. OttesenSCG-928-B03]|nr:peptidoglycan DD-metalloendopeptidase family protein [Alistipes sp. OttesenSCG-928-B03]
MKRTPRADRPAMSFSGKQCDHVKLLQAEPIGGTLAVNLDDIRREFVYPYNGKLISDYGVRNGRMHTGVDIKAIPNDTIRAAMPGVVRMSKDYSGYGNVVVIRHYNGLETLYAHGARNLVDVNDVVEAGDPVALAGRTGRATTEHLHFELRAAGYHFDPKYVVDTDKKCIREGWLYVTDCGSGVVAANSREQLKDSHLAAVAAIAEGSAAREKAIADSTENGKPKGPSQPEAVYYTIKSGDTLSAIAVRQKTTVKKICELNKIKSTAVLRIGQRLRVR